MPGQPHNPELLFSASAGWTRRVWSFPTLRCGTATTDTWPTLTTSAFRIERGAGQGRTGGQARCYLPEGSKEAAPRRPLPSETRIAERRQVVEQRHGVDEAVGHGPVADVVGDIFEGVGVEECGDCCLGGVEAVLQEPPSTVVASDAAAALGPDPAAAGAGLEGQVDTGAEELVVDGASDAPHVFAVADALAEPAQRVALFRGQQVDERQSCSPGEGNGAARWELAVEGVGPRAHIAGGAGRRRAQRA